jgi:GH43 family beta-xylosidase
MAQLPGDHACYWAPEVTYDNGRFYLYYSVGDEANMHIRVAVASHPAGPFVDSGHQLTAAQFAIDAHVFTDDDGRRYLFYATDFLDHTHIGTGTVMDRLLDPFTLAGQPQLVTRAIYDWQVYDPQRKEKGGVRWHTIEGSFVLKHRGRYYHLFSGGNWQNLSYGVGYATTQTLDGPDEWAQMCDGEQTFPILRTVPGKVIGPGHNSVVRGPDNRQLYCVYHRWAQAGNGEVDFASGRLLAIDPLDWAGERLLILGPSHTPQPLPNLPTFADFFTGDERDRLGNSWHCVGEWQVQAGAAVSVTPIAQASYPVALPAFIAEVSLKATAPERTGSFGIDLGAAAPTLLSLRFIPAQRELAIRWQSKTGHQAQSFPLPAEFNFQAFHLLRWEVRGNRVSLALHGTAVQWQTELAHAPHQITLCAENCPAAFAGFAVTLGWQLEHVQNLPYELAAYELVFNVRVPGADGRFALQPAFTPSAPGPLLTVEQDGLAWLLRWQEAATTQTFPLPTHFDPAVFQQFRFRKQHGRLTIHWETHFIAEGAVTKAETQVMLDDGRGTAEFDLLRVTALGDSEQ